METITRERKTRKRRDVAPSVVVEVEKEEEKVDLKAKLREKMMKQKLGRTKQVIIDREIENIEEALEDTRTGTKLRGKDKKKLKERLKLLEEVEEKRAMSINDDPAVYIDNASYGGGFEHPE